MHTRDMTTTQRPVRSYNIPIAASTLAGLSVRSLSSLAGDCVPGGKLDSILAELHRRAEAVRLVERAK